MHGGVHRIVLPPACTVPDLVYSPIHHVADHRHNSHHNVEKSVHHSRDESLAAVGGGGGGGGVEVTCSTPALFVRMGDIRTGNNKQKENSNFDRGLDKSYCSCKRIP